MVCYNATLLAHQRMNRVVLTLADQIWVKAANDNRIGVKQWGAAAICHMSAERLISHPCIMSVYDLHLAATHSWPWIRDPPWLWPWQKNRTSRILPWGWQRGLFLFLILLPLADMMTPLCVCVCAPGQPNCWYTGQTVNKRVVISGASSWRYSSSARNVSLALATQ